MDRFFMNLLADRKAVGSTPKYSLLDGDRKQSSIFSPCMRYKWVNRIDRLTKLTLTRKRLIWKSPVFCLFYQFVKIGKHSLEQHSKSQFQSLCKVVEIMYSLTSTFKNIGKAERIYIKQGWSHIKLNIMN